MGAPCYGALLLALPCLVHAGIKVLCFEHTGPQDKSMPAFCVLEPAVIGAGEALIRADSAGWADLQQLLAQQGQPDAGAPMQPGGYRVSALPPAPLRYVGPQATRTVILRLLAMPGLGPPQAQLLTRLLARLPPSTRGG